MVFAPKADVSLRLCVVYRRLNDITVKNRDPIPLVGEMLDQLGSRVFSKLDLKNAYQQLRLRQRDEHKTAFRTRRGLFEFLVVPFGLTNAPAFFSAFARAVLGDLVERGVVVYLDDILVHAPERAEHERLVRLVLECLIEAPYRSASRTHAIVTTTSSSASQP